MNTHANEVPNAPGQDPSTSPDEPGLLAGHVALVAGGSGNVGRYIVGGLLDAGATVVVPSRSPAKLDQVQERHGGHPHGRLVPIAGNIADPDEGPGILDRVVEEEGGLDHGVASLGRFVPTRAVLEASPQDLQAVLDGYLLAHFSVARHLIPVLRKSSRNGEAPTYTSVNGPLAWDLWGQESSLVSIATSAQAMLARAVMDQEDGHPDGVRVNELVIHTAVGWGDTGKKSPYPPHEIGRYVARVVSPLGRDLSGATLHLRSKDQVDALG